MPATRKKTRDAEATRAAILAAARERFAADGYDRATLRAIAADAGIDPALVIRYFGNKEGLFAAAAEFDLRLPDFSSMPRARAGAALVEHFLARWEGDDTLQALLRAAVTNRAAAARMRAIFAAQVAPAIGALVRGRHLAPERAGLIASQVLGIALCRYILGFPPLRAMSRAALVESLGPVIQRHLDAA
jgi:AcrR family transcriptional regulator